MTEREKILREGLDEIAKYKSDTEFPNSLTLMDAITMRGIARETTAKADATTKQKCYHCEGSGVDVDQLEQCPVCKGTRFVPKADADPSSSLLEAVKLERELIYDILLVAQMNGGFIPEHQMKAMMAWLDQPLPGE